MTRIDSYEDLTDKIVGWLKDYYWIIMSKHLL